LIVFSSSGGSMRGRSTPTRARKIFLNVSENKSSDRKVIFIFWYSRKRCWHYTECFTTAVSVVGLPSAEAVPPAHPLGAQPPVPRLPPSITNFSIRHCFLRLWWRAAEEDRFSGKVCCCDYDVICWQEHDNSQSFGVLYRPTWHAVTHTHLFNGSLSGTNGWRRDVVVSGVRRMNEVNARRARLVPGWVTVFGWVYHLGM